MTVVATIPIKSDSKRVPRKNFREFGGNPLYEHFFNKISPSNPFDDVYVDTDSNEIKESAQEYGFKTIDRKKSLTTDHTCINEVLVYDSEIIDADYYFQLFVTAPLLSSSSIKESYDKLIADGNHDSVFTVTEEHSFFWYNGDVINYNPLDISRTQDLAPVLEETTGVYGISREALEDRKSRIGHNPKPIPVHPYEAVDIDNESDLELARCIYSELLNGDCDYSQIPG